MDQSAPGNKAKQALALSVISLFAMGVCALTIRGSVSALKPEHVYRKDILQEYLLGKALAEGKNPYLPIPELASEYLGDLPNTVFPHPTPHPPLVALVSLPLANFEYPVAAAIWLVIELGCIITALFILLRKGDPRPPWWFLPPIIALFLGTEAYFRELVLGQLQSIVLLLLIWTWLAFKEGRDWLTGVSLGAALALKFLGWPILLFLAFRRRWKALTASLLSAVSFTAASALVMGIGPITEFYLRVGPQVSQLYRGDPSNIALSSIGWRVFSGTGSQVLVALSAPPLLHWPLGAAILSVLLPVVFAVVAVWAAHRMRSLDAAFALLLCASSLVSPIAWVHYALLGSPAVIWIWKLLHPSGFPRIQTLTAFALSLCLFIPTDLLNVGSILLTGGSPVPNEGMTVPFSAALLTLLPTITLVGLCALLWRLSRPLLSR
jgi:hypothetical protein